MYEAAVVGGGIAGLQAAIQLGRYQHKVLVIDKGYGRSTLCRSYHNVLGWPNGISGPELRTIGREQASSLGVLFAEDTIVSARKQDNGHIRLQGARGHYEAQTLLIATGILDRFPDLPGIKECLGLSIYVCPDCDGYEVSGRSTIVLGSGKAGAAMAILLKDWTDELVFLNHEQKEIPESWQHKLQDAGIRTVHEAAASIHSEAGMLRHVELANGERLEAERGFLAFGGNAVHSDWTRSLGVERMENRHIVTDPRSKVTNIEGIWAAGDIGVHAEQVSVAMGEGSLAAIWMHKYLKAGAKSARFPQSSLSDS
ncbi:NAD(P)/FAD-dependent oxidoreductase [Xylanibacillus composti]|nr:NAD(P)/FAD-dependent oxidoreductase [Xylanibacillus composti]